MFNKKFLLGEGDYSKDVINTCCKCLFSLKKIAKY